MVTPEDNILMQTQEIAVVHHNEIKVTLEKRLLRSFLLNDHN